MDVAKFTLRGLVAPEQLAHRRDWSASEPTPNGGIKLPPDDRTIAYDAVRIANGTVLLTCPPLYNFWPLLRDGLRVDGKRPRGLERHRIGKCEQLRLRAPEGAQVTLRLDDHELELPVRPSEAPAFHGRRLLKTLSRNNDLDWISAWARFHVRAHGADAVVFYDNVSDRYNLDDIAATLAGVKGLDVIRVVGSPFTYGGEGDQPNGHRIWIGSLQHAMLNLTRVDMGAGSQAVLNCDIDELVIPTTGQSVFDAARRALRGGIIISGSWVYPAARDATERGQQNHYWRAVPDRPCPAKWCARPSSIFCRLDGWQEIHTYGGKWMKRTVGRGNYRPHPGFHMAHCSGTTTGWNPDSGRFEFPKDLRRDPDLERALELARP